MARYYRRRYTRVVKNKKKWATNLVQAQTNVSMSAAGNAGGVLLVQNAVQSANPTPVIIKAGNFKLQIEYQFQSAGSGVNGASVNAYIIYVPEASITLESYTNVLTYVKAHPEYIMGMKVLDISNVSGNTNVTTMSSRLKRNLNSGDRILLLITSKLADGSTGTVSGYINVLGQFWTTSA